MAGSWQQLCLQVVAVIIVVLICDTVSTTTIATTAGGGIHDASEELQVRVAKCGSTVKGVRQKWRPLHAGSGAPAPITIADGSCCISTVSCHTCAADCHLVCVACNRTDGYQLFQYNSSTGVVTVPPAGAPDCSARPSLHGPWCFNLFDNQRKDGQEVDVFVCGYPTSDLLLGPGKDAGTLEVRDDDALCLSTGPASAWPAPAPPPSPPPAPPPDPGLSCAMRLLAFEVASQRLSQGGGHGPRNLRSVWDSLELETACAGQPTSPPARPEAPVRPTGSSGEASLSPHPR